MKITLEQAIQFLLEGHNVAIPTETVYGLAAHLHSDTAIENIFRLKNRPATNPLIVHLDSLEKCVEYISFKPCDFEKLAGHFWPGPLTLLAKIRQDTVPAIARANLDTCAFRIPNHPLTLQLLKAVGPVVAPSANISGRPSATSKDHVEQDFGKDFPVLDSGVCTHGLESTICSFHDGRWKIARLGAISQEMLAHVLGYVPEVYIDLKKPICPGQHFRHYAPRAKLILFDCAYTALSEKPSCILGFTDRTYDDVPTVFSFGSTTEPDSVAKNLYTMLRLLDENTIETAWVDCSFPDHGIWKTIKERLVKASTT